MQRFLSSPVVRCRQLRIITTFDEWQRFPGTFLLLPLPLHPDKIVEKHSAGHNLKPVARRPSIKSLGPIWQIQLYQYARPGSPLPVSNKKAVWPWEELYDGDTVFTRPIYQAAHQE